MYSYSLEWNLNHSRPNHSVFNAHAIYLRIILNCYWQHILTVLLFQGLEKIALLQHSTHCKMQLYSTYFIVISSTNDYQWVHALWGISYIIVDIAAFIFIRTKCNVRLTLPSINQIKALFGISFEYFLSRVAIAIYLSTNVIIIGILLLSSHRYPMVAQKNCCLPSPPFMRH